MGANPNPLDASTMVGGEGSKKDDDPTARYIGTTMEEGGGGAMEAEGSQGFDAGERLIVPSSHLPSLALVMCKMVGLG